VGRLADWLGGGPVLSDAAEIAVVEKPEPGTPFQGAGACFREGFFYPLVNDEHGREVGPDLSSPLVWLPIEGHPKGGHLVHAAPTSSNHFHTFGLNTVELEISPTLEEQQ
jgi:hypothetical protein